MRNSTPNNPADVNADYRGQVRTGNGYEFWATSEEDDVTQDYGDFAKPAVLAPTEPPKAKRRRRRGLLGRLINRVATVLLIAILAALAYYVFTYVQVQRSADESRSGPADAAVVLGAAQYAGSPSPVLQERLDHAFDLFSDEVVSYIMTTGAGAEGEVNTEGLAGYVYLRNQGVPEENIIVIPEGVNTWEQMSASLYQIDQRDFDSVLLVSDRYHNYRLLAIADELGIDAGVSPSAIEPEIDNYLREAAAVSIGRITGYRRLSAFTTD